VKAEMLNGKMTKENSAWRLFVGPFSVRLRLQGKTVSEFLHQAAVRGVRRPSASGASHQDADYMIVVGAAQ
jgi:hypothetical protein